MTAVFALFFGVTAASLRVRDQHACIIAAVIHHWRHSADWTADENCKRKGNERVYEYTSNWRPHAAPAAPRCQCGIGFLLEASCLLLTRFELAAVRYFP